MWQMKLEMQLVSGKNQRCYVLPDKGDVNTQPSMHRTAIKTNKNAISDGCPRRISCKTIEANFVLWLCAQFPKDCIFLCSFHKYWSAHFVVNAIFWLASRKQLTVIDVLNNSDDNNADERPELVEKPMWRNQTN